jgi:hypothetical protein
MRRDCVFVELYKPPRPYSIRQMIQGWRWSALWNITDLGKPKDWEKNLSQYSFFHHKSHHTNLGATLGLRL